jgi:hypothetical protein
MEVLGIGMMETVAYAGFDPEAAARSVLDEFVRRRAARGVLIPAIDEVCPPDVRPQAGI